jgi:hypothetical protein
MTPREEAENLTDYFLSTFRAYLEHQVERDSLYASWSQ